MEKSLVDLEQGTTCTFRTSTNIDWPLLPPDGYLSSFNSSDLNSSSFSLSSKSKVHETAIKVIWVSSKFGDAMACVCEDGTSLFIEEIKVFLIIVSVFVDGQPLAVQSL